MKGVNREKSGFLVSGLANKSVDARLNLKEEPLNGLNLPLKGKNGLQEENQLMKGLKKVVFREKSLFFSHYDPAVVEMLTKLHEPPAPRKE